MANPTKVVFSLPTTNTDGSPLAVSDITGIKVNVLDSKGAVGESKIVATASLTAEPNGDYSVPLPVLPGGSYSVVLYTESVSQGVAEESVGTTAVAFAITVPSVPNPPQAVSVV